MIKVIKNGIVITMNKQKEILKKDIVIENDTIIDIVDNYDEKYDELIDATNKIIMPGLINTHSHLGMSLFRGSNDNLTLLDWLNKKIWPKEDKLTDKDIYYGTLLSCIEMIKTGTTTCTDSYFGVEEAIHAIEETNIRCLYTRCLMDSDGKGDFRLEQFNNLYNKYNNKNSLITFCLGLHSLYTCSYEYLKDVKELADKENLLIQIHCAENEEEIKLVKEKYNMTPVQLLNDLGYLNNLLLLAHCTYLNKEDVDLLKNKNISISHNPISNLNLGCGIAPISIYLRNNINISLGTDGQGSGNNLNLFNHMGYVDLLQKGLFKNPKIMNAYDVLEMATINGAKALGMENSIGSIEINKKADIIILDMNNIEIYPIEDLIFNIVHNISINNVNTTIINGKVLYSNKQLNLNIDEEELKCNIKKILSRIGE